MITNFKIFESISIPYKIGDYILIRVNRKGKLVDNVLAVIKGINREDIRIEIFNEEFERNVTYLINSSYIKCWSEDREELEMSINVNKYNL